MLYSSQHLRTIGAAVAHFLDMEGVTGSIPVSSTLLSRFLAQLFKNLFLKIGSSRDLVFL